jgi:AcrR family transcriptional regulator
MGTIREPIKKTSIEKKQRIIEKGFNLICEKGYHNVNSIDIAKEAGVSTGLIYQYFDDKNAIFIEGVKKYSADIMFPMINILEKNDINRENIKQLFSDIIDKYIKTHKMSKKAHEELLSMSHSNKEVEDIFRKDEEDLTIKMAGILVKNGFSKTNINEKVHIIYNMIDQYCHEVVYHKHTNIDYLQMKQEIIEITSFILK